MTTPTQNREVPRLVVSQKTAAEMLDVCVDTIENLVKRGQLDRVRITGRKYGIPVSSLQKLVEAR